ncbi:prepilin-type cleavage/methylation domain-containing protein [Rheinheimera riviphila]|uniref:Prepilin-type cleavage/methylation domain-containing protein n=1 Tax=Rheinheimera riviphila TaxID=1834037 RepID=A0A437QGA4_9GAMM|nr:prepilin-type N-terminal cleavage/methylation domain-containing protein [Rheinheimera riviphila]RVU33370.1 prepilin-type cleavage/methylation domain-containing protein [Rheinheimera riviphila]
MRTHIQTQIQCQGRSQGFSLIEALVAMLLASLGLLGLASAQIKALQYAGSSLSYTVATIQAHNAVERIWPQLCALQQGGVLFDAAFINTLQPQTDLDPAGYQIDFEAFAFNVSPYQPAPAAPLPLTMLELAVSWNDVRLDDGEANIMDIQSSFPWLRNGNPTGCI